MTWTSAESSYPVQTTAEPSAHSAVSLAPPVAAAATVSCCGMPEAAAEAPRVQTGPTAHVQHPISHTVHYAIRIAYYTIWDDIKFYTAANYTREDCSYSNVISHYRHKIHARHKW